MEAFEGSANFVLEKDDGGRICAADAGASDRLTCIMEQIPPEPLHGKSWDWQQRNATRS
jgi:hypothetical protein